MSDKESESEDTQGDEVELFVAGLVLDPASNAPIVILKNESGETCLPIWIGLAEATAIASALKQVDIQRPMTHDLLCNVIEDMGARIIRIYIRGLEDNTFLADIELALGDVTKVIDARPSDAIAIAVRVNSPIVVSAKVLERAQVQLVPVDEQSADESGQKVSAGEFIQENFSNIDEEKWVDILESMDPDDFKYKM